MSMPRPSLDVHPEPCVTSLWRSNGKGLRSWPLERVIDEDHRPGPVLRRAAHGTYIIAATFAPRANSHSTDASFYDFRSAFRLMGLIAWDWSLLNDERGWCSDSKNTCDLGCLVESGGGYGCRRVLRRVAR